MHSSSVPTSRDAPLESIAPTSSTRKRLLVVEDDADLVAVLERIASSIDADIVMDWAPDVEVAERQMHERRYDVVLADFLLESERTGFALRSRCERLQPHAAFAMMSSMPLDVPGEDPCPFLRKPFTVAECREFLRTMLP
jgi:DNA-binding NtrC family response regulator